MKKTIAVVDDDQPILEVITYILKEEGFNVVPYDNGEALLADNTRENLNLVLLDYRLPNKNGLEIAKMIKSEQKTKDVPIIITSANHNLERLLKNSPIDDFIPKPFELETLMRKIYQYLKLPSVAF